MESVRDSSAAPTVGPHTGGCTRPRMRVGAQALAMREHVPGRARPEGL